MPWYVPLGVRLPQAGNHWFRGKKKEAARGNSAMKVFIICTAHQILLDDHIQEDKMGWTCGKNKDNKYAYRVLFDKCNI